MVSPSNKPMPIAPSKAGPAVTTKTVPLPANKNSRPAATSAGATARTYEIHRNSGGRWLLDSVADEKDVGDRDGEGAARRRARALRSAGSTRSRSSSMARSAKSRSSAPRPRSSGRQGRDAAKVRRSEDRSVARTARGTPSSRCAAPQAP